MRTVELRLYVEYDESRTTAEDVAVALDQLLETSMSTADVLDGVGNPQIGQFLVNEDGLNSDEDKVYLVGRRDDLDPC